MECDFVGFLCMQKWLKEATYLYNQAYAAGWRRSPICPCLNRACIGMTTPCFCVECKSWRTRMGFLG